MASVVKLLSLAVVTIALIIIGYVGSYLMADYWAYRKVAITPALLRDGMYDPALHYNFDLACVFPTESGLAHTWLAAKGYREIDAIFPDTFTNWTLVLVDDNKKTFRTLFISEPKVKFGGPIICNPRITLRTTISNGEVVAHVEEAR